LDAAFVLVSTGGPLGRGEVLSRNTKTWETSVSINQYNGMVDYYDLLMLGGYYDYDAQAASLKRFLPPGGQILEVGVGTGLLAKKLIDLGYAVTGVDHTRAMLDKARALLGAGASLHEADVVTLNLGRRFDAAVSNGGVWYGVWDGDRYGYCGHLPDVSQVGDSLLCVGRHVVPGGRLVLSLQPRHTDKTMELPEGVLYEQRIIPRGKSVLEKQYLFSRGATRLAYQSLLLAYIDNALFEDAAAAAGFGKPTVTPDRFYLMFEKRR
jgi:SAM-dependent methyltransferase